MVVNNWVLTPELTVETLKNHGTQKKTEHHFDVSVPGCNYKLM